MLRIKNPNGPYHKLFVLSSKSMITVVFDMHIAYMRLLPFRLNNVFSKSQKEGREGGGIFKKEVEQNTVINNSL